ncbi:MAG TPA: ABC transporter permease, partial [Stellaceae bacterium]|nr:ABC transporter permease [Stellaceae bacterium]
MSRPAVFGAFERMVAFRYLRARRQEGFVSVIAFFSLAGVAVGVATLIIVMSVMGGVEHEVLAKVLGFNGDLSAYSATGGGIAGFDALVAKARAVPGVASVTPVVDGNALVSSARGAQGAQIRGERIEDLMGPHGIGRYKKEGSLDQLDDDSVVIGERLAFDLGVG